MGWFYRRLLRPFLFLQDSEPAHDRVLARLASACESQSQRRLFERLYGSPELPVKLFGLRFPNPVGLAAGMDKYARAMPIWENLGFGFCEVGGVTWRPQEGNPRPRMFRIPEDGALINRMGFNNPGAQGIAAVMQRWKSRGMWPGIPVGINLGKSKVVPLEEAAKDYRRTFETLWPYADFFVINVSSPNTPNLRKLQDRAFLKDILAELQRADQKLAAGEKREGTAARKPSPILVKVAPELADDALREIAELSVELRLDGIVATNTTTDRPGSPPPRLAKFYGESGGLSGRPLRARSTERIKALYEITRGELPVIGVGGIFDAGDAWEKITAGASLVQVYTGLVYEGPSVARSIVTGLKSKLAERGMTSIAEAVGLGEKK